MYTIDDAIRASGLKRQHIANRLGITRAALYNKLSGRNELTLGEACALADLLGIDITTVNQLITTTEKGD